MRIVKYLIILFLIFPISCMAEVSREDYNNAVANVSLSTAHTYSDDFAYSFYWGGTPSDPINYSSKLSDYMRKAYKGIKIESGSIYGTTKADAGIHGSFSNKFPVYCATYVKIMVYHASNGQATFNYGSNDSYEKIKISDLRRGDIIDFKNHVAIFIDDGMDNKDSTWHVVEASGKIYDRVITSNDVEGAFRIKDSVLATLDANSINSSYDFHDRLDDYPPVIVSIEEISNSDKIRINANDYKHYELDKKNDVLEPESNGIVAYQVTTSGVKPTTNWINVNRTTTLNVEARVKENGLHYVYVKDIGGNVSVKQINLTKMVIDKEPPSLGNCTYEGYEDSIKVTIADAKDNVAIKEYRYYLDGKLMATTKDNTYYFKNLSRNKDYIFYYEIVDNSDNIAKSENIEVYTEIDAKEINLLEESVYLLKGETYQLKPVVKIDSNNYHIKYVSSDERIVSVSSNGLITANNNGTCAISVSVGKTTKLVKVKVSTYKIEFQLDNLEEAYIDEEYDVLIETNYNSTITIDGELPKGLRLQDNKIVGIPEISGDYKIKVIATYLDSENVKEYQLVVKYHLKFNNESLKKAYINKEYNEEIILNYPGTITLINGTLPPGIELINNKLVGTPTIIGEYYITLKGQYNDSEITQNYVLKVTNNNTYLIYIGGIVAIVVILYIILKPKKRKK